MIGQMRGHDFRKALVNSGFTVSGDALHYSVSNGQQIACFELYEDGPFRWGWIEDADGRGRRDYTDWLSFSIDIQELHS